VIIELIHKLQEKTEVKDNHWLWKGSLMGENKKYGSVFLNGSNYKVGRLILSKLYRLKYKDYSWYTCHIDSICKYTECWNPTHLYVGTASSNTLDVVKIKGIIQYCKYGHELTEENTYIQPSNNTRHCRICKYQRKVKENERNRLQKQKNASS
jgi:hypothetical protein